MSTTKPVAVKRYVVVGVGGRSGMFTVPLAGRFKDEAKLVAICDNNQGRMEFARDRLKAECGYDVPRMYLADDFDKMLAIEKPDCVVVCTPDYLHHDFAVRAMRAGCDVITEKPMTIDAEKASEIFKAVKETGKQVRVTFNARYQNGPTMVKRMISEGLIGNVKAVNMDYWLDTSHGADYFRRWHREKAKSGGLMLHKSTHHFDLINWWIDSIPETVFGMGQLSFYGRENAEKRGVEVKYDRYTGNDTTGDPFAYKLDASENVKKMYLDQEKYDGYRRDQNVFGDGITSEDNMAVMVRYRNGVQMVYSLVCFLPREGYRVCFRGDKGEMEYVHGVELQPPNGVDVKVHKTTLDRIYVRPMFKEPYVIEVPKAEGGHGGADPLLQEQLFAANPPVDPDKRHAGHGQGAASLILGAAANVSFATGQPVSVSKLLPELGNAVKLSELP
jgi:predicted dehydrogenase